MHEVPSVLRTENAHAALLAYSVCRELDRVDEAILAAAGDEVELRLLAEHGVGLDDLAAPHCDDGGRIDRCRYVVYELLADQARMQEVAVRDHGDVADSAFARDLARQIEHQSLAASGEHDRDLAVVGRLRGQPTLQRGVVGCHEILDVDGAHLLLPEERRAAEQPGRERGAQRAEPQRDPRAVGGSARADAYLQFRVGRDVDDVNERSLVALPMHRARGRHDPEIGHGLAIRTPARVQFGARELEGVRRSSHREGRAADRAEKSGQQCAESEQQQSRIEAREVPLGEAAAAMRDEGEQQVQRTDAEERVEER